MPTAASTSTSCSRDLAAAGIDLPFIEALVDLAGAQNPQFDSVPLPLPEGRDLGPHDVLDEVTQGDAVIVSGRGRRGDGEVGKQRLLRPMLSH